MRVTTEQILGGVVSTYKCQLHTHVHNENTLISNVTHTVEMVKLS